MASKRHSSKSSNNSSKSGKSSQRKNGSGVNSRTPGRDANATRVNELGELDDAERELVRDGSDACKELQIAKHKFAELTFPLTMRIAKGFAIVDDLADQKRLSDKQRNKWFREQGYGGVARSTRTYLRKIAENAPDVERWHGALGDKEKGRVNSATTIYKKCPYIKKLPAAEDGNTDTDLDASGTFETSIETIKNFLRSCEDEGVRDEYVERLLAELKPYLPRGEPQPDKVERVQRKPH